MKRNSKSKRERNRAIGLRALERITLLNLLSEARGGFVTLRLLGELQDRLGFRKAELRRLKFRTQADGSTQWNAASDAERPFRFHPLEKDLIVKQLKEMDRAKTLTAAHRSIVLKFIGESAFATEEGG